MVVMNFIKAKYKFVVERTKDFAWLKNLMTQLKILNKVEPTTLWCDNMSSLKIAKNLILHIRTKHVEVHYHCVREQVKLGYIDLTHVRWDNQLENIIIKRLGRVKFEQLRKQRSIVSLSTFKILKLENKLIRDWLGAKGGVEIIMFLVELSSRS
jgi:hypothetical protein